MDRVKVETLLRKWNPHFDNVSKGAWVGTVPRTHYLQRIEKMLELRHILFLTGVRRSGKTTILHQLIQWLIQKEISPVNVVYWYLEDIEVMPYLSLGAQLLEKLYTVYREKYNPHGRVYICIDELQGIKDFNHWLHTYYEFNRTNLKFIVSGSRQSLIQSEAATVLTGRNIQFDVYPLNFYEYLLLHKVDVQMRDTISGIRDAHLEQTPAILHHLGNFLHEGGFPEIVLTPDTQTKRSIANRYYRDTLARDILLPHAVRSPREVEILGISVLSDFTKTHTYRSLGVPGNLSVETVKTYLEYFYDSYLFFESRFFSYKTKETQNIQRPRKLYVVDNGLRNFNTLTLRPDLGQCAENIVYMELAKNTITVYYWKGKREIDFVTMNPDLALYNVSYTDELPEREIEGMVEGLKEFNKKTGVILTKNYTDTKKIDGKIIECIPLWAWLIAHGRTFFRERTIQ